MMMFLSCLIVHLKAQSGLRSGILGAQKKSVHCQLYNVVRSITEFVTLN